MAKLLAFDARLSSLADIGLVEPPENNFIGSPLLCDWDQTNIAFVSCNECGNQNYCTECDEVLHRHPDKRHHKRVQTHSQPHSTTAATTATSTTTATATAAATLHQKRKKKKGERCRCGTGASKGTLGDPCTGNRCPCYSEGRGCAHCGCKGCKNPYKETPAPTPPQFQPHNVHIQHPLTIPNFSSMQGTAQTFTQLLTQANGSPPKVSSSFATHSTTTTPHFPLAQHSLTIDSSSHPGVIRTGSPQSVDMHHSPQNIHTNPLSHVNTINPPNNNIYASPTHHPIYHAPRHSHLHSSEQKIQTLPLSVLHPLSQMNYHPTHLSAMYHPPSSIVNPHNKVEKPPSSMHTS
eukprot:TRINITY_DN102_c0_g2_i1.p1 TRINITY_DN102_c0_g2~~TRINITY_DN102_c0_g2_i1.p1  ORF type:complete len:349 (-),score=58.34 TRINITY_DN102_c0_g2_i1:105-1151(-)